jgi:uncharacterized protein (DUF111 family)
MKVLFLDCFSGISGDMTVGALVDLGVKPSTLEWELSKLDIGDFHLHFERQKRQQVEGVKFGIHEGATHTHEQDEPHGHDHGHEHHHHEGCSHGHFHETAHSHQPEGEHTHAHAQEHSHEHQHSHKEEHDQPEHGGETHDHEHRHEHDHDHGSEVHAHHHHPQEHGRSHRQIRALIEHSELSPYVKKHALSIFQRIAVAEGKIHGQPPEDVEFHEVGALDSIADIISACVGLETLGVEKVFISSLHDGCGTVSCAHGTFPVPTPATLEILKGIPVGQIGEPNELITPTGAAIAAEFGASFGPMPQIRSEKIGYGLGTRDLASRPNVLRAVLGTLVED